VRFLFVDRITEFESGKRAAGIKNVSMSEDFLAHHFPHLPIMPGALITEALVQLAGWIIQERSEFKHLGMVREFQRLKFYKMVRPGDQLLTEASVISWRTEGVDIKAQASCGGAVAAAARFGMAFEPLDRYIVPADARRQFELLRA
jgi:3-hydroxyacyl-[acyl-carrier-protein] dehydratase